MSRRGRIVLLILAPLLLLLALPVSFIVRETWFPRHFGVESIARLPAYQEPELLAQAWTLPTARTLLARRQGLRATILRGLTLDEFRTHLVKANDPGRRYIINFHRGLLFDIGHGHFSPLAGYLPDQDQAFVLDVNDKFRPWLAPAQRLFLAIDSTDSASGQKRGLLLIER